MRKSCCEYERNWQKRRSKIRETFAFFILKKGKHLLCDDRERRNDFAGSVLTQNCNIKVNFLIKPRKFVM